MAGLNLIVCLASAAACVTINAIGDLVTTLKDSSREYAPPQLSRRGPTLWKLFLLRALFVVLGLVAWFVTQHLIGARAYHGTIEDGILSLLTPVHQYLLDHAGARNALLITSSLGIDSLAVFLLLRSIFGPTIRPFLGLLVVFGLRQIFQALCVLPEPEKMIWVYPGFPSLLVTYGVSNDLFFSGHTALAVFGAVELARLRRGLIPLGIAIAVFEVVAVLALRAHWTMDVYAGAVTALLVALVAGPMARPVDRLLGRITGAQR
ncbi:MAG TPA: phosphatase PAP2 family protein [Phycisphaerae bacterium]